MHQLLDEALAHVKVRCEVENSIIATACEQRDQLAPGSEKSYQLTEISPSFKPVVSSILPYSAV